jgi:hypothetical protein
MTDGAMILQFPTRQNAPRQPDRIAELEREISRLEQENEYLRSQWRAERAMRLSSVREKPRRWWHLGF